MSGNAHVDVMLAGAAAAFTVDMLIYPLDTLKTRQQSRDFVRTFATTTTTGGAKGKLPPRQLFRGLYQGIGIVVVATLPAAGVFFTTYEAAKSFLLSREKHSLLLPQPLVHAAASATAECASCLVLTPAEVVKQNAQMLLRRPPPSSSPPDHHPDRGGSRSASASASTSLEALRRLRGRSLLSGYAALVARNLPFTALQFPLFEHARETLWGYHLRRRRRRKGKGDGVGKGESESGEKKKNQGLLETGVVTGLSAGLAGSFAAAVTTPMDVVKTRLMLAAGDERAGSRSSSSSSSSSKGGRSVLVVREVLAEQGVPGLFRGALLRSVWTAVGSGLYLGMYEVAKVWLTRGDGNNGDDSFP
ncbi:mitochondrial S-adenosylmethionine transporter [Biscogniauxia mediterranea]|nr:mitochondrial S-adenosylmethionine transporter [Biscogniauxia mediterranea]